MFAFLFCGLLQCQAKNGVDSGIDLVAGVFYTATGVVHLSLSGFPLFNATWILLLLLWWMPKAQPEAVRNH